jgi:hypothetical protein
MRMHYSREITLLVRGLGEEGVALRRAIESLKTTPVPEWAREVPEWPGRYEWFVAGYWLVYEIDRSNPSETIIRVILAEPN